MIKMTLARFAELSDCEYIGEKNIYFNRIILDSRKVRTGDLFVAVKGEKTDGHEYIGEAVNRGAVGVVSIGDPERILFEKVNYVFADNLESFLNKTAKVIRKHIGAKIIGITGSVGKTTTKDMLYTVLKEEYQVIKTEGNLNNELGLPITMSLANEETDYLILEMGMRGLGEIRYLCEMAEPDYGIITNIEPVHAEILGNIENIAKAKAEIADSIPREGALIINHKDREILEPFLVDSKAPVYTVGFEAEADFFIKDIVSEMEVITEYTIVNNAKQFNIKINAIGKHNIQNSAMVYALGKIIGVNNQSFNALENTLFSDMRFNVKEISGIKIINDAYNANLSSTSYSLDSLKKVTGNRKIFIFGDMFELGQYEKSGHEKIADKIIENKIDYVFLIGEKVQITYNKLLELGYEKDRVFIFEDKDNLVSLLEKYITKGDIILLKASRGMYLETIAKTLEEYLNVL